MKILVVEDDHMVAQTLQLLLSSYSYAVDCAADGEEGLQMAEAFDYDLILLDVMLPKMDGITLCQQLRAQGLQVPILLLTGQGEGQQKAIALNAGADDYVVKPFDNDELIARVQALLRRGGPTSQPILTWGHLSIDPSRRSVTYGTHLLSLTPKEYAILELFLRNSQKALSAKALLDHAWNSIESPGEEAVRVHIKELRQKLTAAGAPKNWIKTIYRVGYQLNPLYSSVLATQREPSLSAPEVAELKSTNQELRAALEQLQATQDELRQKNQELMIAHQVIEQEQQKLKVARDQLELRVAERTAELVSVDQMLHQHQYQWKALFDHALDAIVITNENGFFVDANPAACELFGASKEEMARCTIANFAAPEVDTTQLRQRFLKAGQLSGEFCLHRPDGTVREVDYSAIANFIPDRHLTILRDISDRKRSEAQRQHSETTLRESERRLSTLINNLPGYAYRVANDPNYTPEFISTGVLTVTGYQQDEYLIDRTISCGQEIHPDDAEWVWNLVQQANASQQPYECEYRIITKAGVQKWVWERGRGVYAADGSLAYLEGFVTDISDRKRAEESLRSRDQLYHQILDSIADMVIVKEPDSQVVWANKAFRDYCGMTLEEVQGTIAFPLELTRQYLREDALVFISGQALTISEDPITRHDGAVRLFSTIKAPIYDDHGQVIMLVAVCRDITDQTQTEAKLRQREEFLSSIYSGADQAVFVVEVTAENDFRYSDFNYKAEQVAGKTTQSLQGQTPEEAFGPETGAHFRQNYQRCLQSGKSITYEEQVVLESSTIWTLTTLSPLRNEDGTIFRIVGTALDITDRKQLEIDRQQAETALKEREEQLRLTFDLNDIGSWDWHLDTNLIDWNPNHYRLFGYQPGEVEPSYQLWRSHLHPDDVVEVEQKHIQALETQTDYEAEYRVVLRDGSIRWALGKGRGIYNESGQPVHMLGVTFDITDRKHNELALQQQYRQEYLLADIAQEIRRSLSLNQVLSSTVDRVRAWLNTDRVVIMRFRPDWQGEVIMESVGAECMSIVSTTISDPCFGDRYIEPYRQGRIFTLVDIDQANLNPCHIELLKSFQVKANLVVPILQGETLWGLLIAHHCTAPRQWQPAEITLLHRLATQVGISIQQSELYEQARRELLIREQMQTVLEESEERFRSLSTAAPIGIFYTNVDGICLYANARWQEMSGLSDEDSLGVGWQQALHPDDREMLVSTWEAYLNGGSNTNLPEFRLLTPARDVRWVSARVAAMTSASDEIIGYVGICEDITERKQAELKIREQAALLDIASDAIFVIDLDHRILYWNQGAEDLYGWQATEVIGHSTYELLYGDATPAATSMQTLLEQGEWRGELHKITKTGEEVIVEARWTLVRDEAEQPKFILSVNTDITQKKQLEAQFYRAQRLESLGTLASGIAHELNNILTPVLTISQLLRQTNPALDGRSQQLLKVLEESAKRGAAIVKQILTFARGTGGDRVPLQVEGLLQDLVNVTQQIFPKSISVRYEIPDQPLGLVSADPTYLHQILLNLCVNARDAMRNGGVLTLSAKNCWVDQALAQQSLDAHVGNYVVITVADTGTGMAPDLLDRIFEPFFTTRQQGQGTGLGLSIALGIVRSHGGFLQVASKVGQGTQMMVYLPTTDDELTQRGADKRGLHGNGELVLIVDDDLAVRQTTQALLESHHYKTLVAQDGEEAIALFTKHQTNIDAVLMDVMMPNMDGISAVQTLRTLDPQVSIIALSGLESRRAPVLAAGANVFLVKPYSIEDLLHQLHDLITQTP